MKDNHPDFDEGATTDRMLRTMPRPCIPLSVIAISICGIAVAVGGLGLDVLILRGGASRGMIDDMYRALAMATLPLDVCLLIGSLGALLARPWSRYCLLAWSSLALLYAVSRLIVSVAWAAPTATAQARISAAGSPPSEFSPEFAGMMMVVTGVTVFAMTSVLPVLTLAVFSRRHVREFFYSIPRQAGTPQRSK